MNTPRIRTRCGVLVLSVLVALAVLFGGSFLIGTTAAFAQSGVLRMRWDIITLSNFSPPNPGPGGHASALANDGSMITLTGLGTFLAAPASARFSAVSLGGNGRWETFNATGNSTGSGTYQVLRGPANWHDAPGMFPSNFNDRIGPTADARSGLLFLEIKYSDGSRGVLVVSCHLPVGAPDSIFERVIASKSFTQYWNRMPPVDGVDGNRTAFHVLH